MKIVYLIGNGFDLAQNLNTRYSDFYRNRILNSETPINILKQLKSSIQADITSWADMEKRLGAFTSEMSSLQDLDYVYDFLGSELRDYLTSEQEKLSISEKDIILFHQALCAPEIYLPPESADAIRTHIRDFTKNNKNCEINVISFNYTDVFERSIAYKGKPLEIGKRDGDVLVKLNNVYKIHGALDREMVMGVADTEQITNKELASNVDALDVLVKPRTTALRRDYTSTRCANLIAQADMLVMYGLSIGETDRNWWQLITERLAGESGTRLIIYSHLDEPITLYDYRRLGRKERAIYKQLYECNGISNIRFTRLNRQIFISFNDSLFHLS